MITEVNELKTLTKYISCKYYFKFDGRKFNSDQKWNSNEFQCECKNLKEHHVCKKHYIWNPAAYSCENGKYVGNIIDNSVITCEKIVNITTTTKNPTKTVPTNLKKKITCKTKKSFIFFTFLLIITALISDSCYYLLSPDKISSKTKASITISRHQKIKGN